MIGLGVALFATIVYFQQYIALEHEVLVFVYSAVATVGLITIAGHRRQATIGDYNGQEAAVVERDPAFFVATAVFTAALFVYHPAGMGERTLGVVLLFISLIYYALDAQVER